MMREITFTAFSGSALIATASLSDVALKVRACLEQAQSPILIFEDGTGKQIDLDLSGSEQDILARIAARQCGHEGVTPEAPRSGPGRPKIGVVCREVSLLPRHWEWLTEQSGGASATLRRLVEQTMKVSQEKDQARVSRAAAYRFMWAMAGDLPGFEEASRAFNRKEYQRFDALIESWPPDIKNHICKLVTVAIADEKAASHDA